MTTRPNQPESDEADREKEPTPGGVTQDLERKAEELDTSVEPTEGQTSSRNDKDQTDRRTR